LPSGYFLCDGSAISRTTYADLFTVVGTTHGSGNGSTTFNLPDLRDRFVVGASNSTGDTTYPGVSPGATGGSADSVVVTHNHGISDSGHDHNLLYNHGAFGGTSGAVTPRSGNTPVTPGITGRISSESTGISINNEGVSGTNKNLPPYYSLAYIIQYSQGGDVAKGQKGATGASGSDASISNNADNRVITGGTGTNLNAEANLTFDNSVLKINGTGQGLLTIRTTDNASDRGIAFQNSGNSYVASINAENAGSNAADLVFHVDDTQNTNLSSVEERLRIKTTGALGLNGANYGTSGQVITSQGSGSAPTWTTVFPSGGIIIWSGAANAIPSGWVLCDGSNSTPDLRGRFVVGYHNSNGDYDVGDTGGAETVTLSINEMPAHDHDTDLDGYKVFATGPNAMGFISYGGPGGYPGGYVNMQNTGGGQAHENRPPYYALCYIMKT
jgi:microcystin-dependent protein